jgi:glyoxylase-like metal-dependent hydrolase (beta-lactamase superfamily II)
MIANLAAGVQAFTSNAFLVTGETTALVDSGANFDVVARIREQVDALDRVYLTHTHPDHVDNVPDVKTAFDVETWGYDPDHDLVDNAVADGDLVQIGDHEYEALYTPGHKSDHLCFHSAVAGVCFAGDLVFANGGVGRTDLPGGDFEALVASVDRLRAAVGDDLAALHVGHGPSATDNPVNDIEMAARSVRSR